MANRYEIWDKTSPVLTVVGEYFTPEQWIERYPAAAYVPFVCAKGETKGAVFQSLASLVSVYEQSGADFSECVTDEDKLDVIEAFEDAANDPGDTTKSSAEERTAAALEALVMNSMSNVNDDDPDED